MQPARTHSMPLCPGAHAWSPLCSTRRPQLSLHRCSRAAGEEVVDIHAFHVLEPQVLHGLCVQVKKCTASVISCKSTSSTATHGRQRRTTIISRVLIINCKSSKRAIESNSRPAPYQPIHTNMKAPWTSSGVAAPRSCWPSCAASAASVAPS